MQNGRLSGARRALNDPLTLIGNASSCDIRLSVEGVDPLHCAIFNDSGRLTIHNSTFYNNSVARGVGANNGGDAGGAIFSYYGPTDIEDCTITCPLHGWIYDLKTGKALGGNGRLKTYQVYRDGDDVMLEKPEPVEPTWTI